MTKIEAVLFDLDGTLLDSALDFHFVLNNMLDQQQKPPISLQTLKQQVSNGARAMVSTAFNINENSANFEALKTQFLSDYLNNINEKSQLYPGIDKVLNFLDTHNIPWAVVTNKPETYTNIILKHFKLDSRSASTVCPDHVKNSKPDPEALFLACKQMSVAPENCWYVGDHMRDIQAGKAADMLTVGCGYGYLNDNEKATDWQSDIVINKPIELIAHIEQQLKQPKTPPRL
jgi:phosphoglycolate phosphatase